jgi:serralysin
MRVRCLPLAIAILFLPSPVHAVQIFTATLNGDQEVPPSGSTATGSATLVLSDDEQSLSYAITLVGLDFAFQTPDVGDDVTRAHIHVAPAGTNGPIVFGFINPSDDTDHFALNFVASTLQATMTGVWDADDAGGNLADFLGALRSGGLYLNIHTVRNPGGEIRGQIVPEPDTMTLMTLGLVGLAYLGKPRSARRMSKQLIFRQPGIGAGARE